MTFVFCIGAISSHSVLSSSAWTIQLQHACYTRISIRYLSLVTIITNLVTTASVNDIYYLYYKLSGLVIRRIDGWEPAILRTELLYLADACTDIELISDTVVAKRVQSRYATPWLKHQPAETLSIFVSHLSTLSRISSSTEDFQWQLRQTLFLIQL